MSGSLTRGTSFSLGQQDITAAQFMPLLTSATVANLDRDNVDTSQFSVATRSSTEIINPQANEVWQDSTTNQPETYFGGVFSSAYSSGHLFTLVSGATSMVSGSLMVVSTSASANTGDVTPATNASDFNAVGVSNAPATGGRGVVCAIHGPVKARAVGAITAGDLVIPAGSALGMVDSNGSGPGAVGFYNFGTAISTATGGYVWVSLRR